VTTTCADIISQSQARFGTSGVRGLVGELNDATCFAYTLAFLRHMKQSHGLRAGSSIWVGMDLRPSSPAMVSACMAAISHAGHNPVFCGVIPTPALAFSALQNNAPAVMITGSHIPFDRNGIKFYRASGEMLKEDEKPIETCAAHYPCDKFRRQSLATPHRAPPVELTGENLWKQRYQTAFAGVLNGITIGHYQHSAAGRDLLFDMLQNLGAKVVPLARSENFVPIDTEAVSMEDTKQAQEWSRKGHFDALISTDGDGDRPLLADETGTYFRGDTLGILAARALNASHVATPVSTSTALEKSEMFNAVIRTKIGSPHVIEAMQKIADRPDSRLVGFEANGGFLTQTALSSPWNEAIIQPLPTRDSVLPVLAVIALARRKKVPLSHLRDMLPDRVTASDRLVDTASEKSMALMNLLKSNPDTASALSIGGAELAGLDHTDGLRMTFANGDIVHVRASGNAPEMRIYVESRSDKTAEALLRHARYKLQNILQPL